MLTLVVDSLTLVMIIAGVPMVAIAITTGCVAMLQAITQIQEQSVVHLVRVATFIALVTVGGDMIGEAICDLFERSLRSIETIGRRGM
jgi:type III secretory pathway component EscS